MKQTNLLKFIYEIRTLCILIVMQFGFYTHISAQSLTCNNNINVSVDATCSAVITPDMILEGTYNYANFTVSIKVTVTGPTGNSCWGYLTIEDKLDPVINCSNAVIDCDDPLPAAPTATDACGPATVAMISEVIVDNGCAGLYSETITRIWQATDGSGNTSTCTQVIERERTTLADILFPANATINCTEDPNAVDPVTGVLLTGEPLGTGCSNIIISSADNIVPVCSGTYKVFRTWTAVDWCAPNSNNTVSILQVINVMDSTPPVVTNPGTLTFGTSSNNCAYRVLFKWNANSKWYLI